MKKREKTAKRKHKSTILEGQLDLIDWIDAQVAAEREAKKPEEDTRKIIIEFPSVYSEEHAAVREYAEMQRTDPVTLRFAEDVVDDLICILPTPVTDLNRHKAIAFKFASIREFIDNRLETAEQKRERKRRAEFFGARRRECR